MLTEVRKDIQKKHKPTTDEAVVRESQVQNAKEEERKN